MSDKSTKYSGAITEETFWKWLEGPMTTCVLSPPMRDWLSKALSDMYDRSDFGFVNKFDDNGRSLIG